MNIEALLVVGSLCLVVGALLYIPGRLLGRRLSKRHPQRAASRRITRAGAVFYGASVAVLLVGFAQQHVAPESWFGQFVATPVGRLAFTAVVVAVWAVFELALRKLGVVLVQRAENGA
jgi:hypothetical protein